MISENLASILLVAFVIGFAVLGFLLLRKKRIERTVMTEVVSAPPPVERVDKLQSALASTRKGWVARLALVLKGRNASQDEGLEQLEEILFSADIGVKTSAKLIEIARKKEASITQVSDAILEILQRVKAEPIAKNGSATPRVIMFVGVNGVGKTTSIGKVAATLAGEGHSVVLGAGDTFRAAAAEQLDIWATRAGAAIVRGKQEADPSSVLFDAVALAKSKGSDFVLCDTAGRLHTKVNLMEELKKVHRVLGKACEGAPHEVLLVVDATTGQNAIEQARQFMAATPLTGVILTKLDGTAKGGVVIGIADELQIPIRYIGVGEGVSDLRPFDAEEFVKALFAGVQGEESHVS